MIESQKDRMTPYLVAQDRPNIQNWAKLYVPGLLLAVLLTPLIPHTHL